MEDYKFNFNRFFKFFNALSFVLIIISIVLLIFKGLNFGVDFKGGTLIELRATDKQITISQIRQSFLNMKLGDVTVKEFGKPHKEIFITALRSISKLRSTISKKNISIIGDGLETDIAGGNAIGINTILITDGILSKELKTEDEKIPDKKLLSKILKRYKTIPNAAAVRFTITP